MFPFFKLLVVVVSTPILIGLLAFGITSRKTKAGKILLGLLGMGLAFILLMVFLSWWSSKTILDKEDYYGDYVIDRTFFPGEQVDWQYNHFRFRITEDDSILFHLTNDEKILRTYVGTTRYVKPFSSTRVAIRMEQPTHHITSSNPTTYRGSWDFFLVFYSPKFNNMYFRKGAWKPIDE